ncbi:MAG TPA: glycine cleavage system aminomethyltransferase GcvT [Pirellulaceae bacterium]|nr:glycine cleavage system aminomethyltransferase GcvT [Pirellulaceae bacterium]
MAGDLLQTPLHGWHASHGARLVDFALWHMPVQYGSIALEHQATRKAAALFDVSHMGRIRFDGRGAEAFLDHLLTRKVAGMGPGKIRYSLVCNERGGILDDVLIYHLHAHSGGLYYQLVVNASNREKILAWLADQKKSHHDVQYTDQTFATAMIAVQGPLALRIAEPLVGADLGGLAYYTGCETTICGHAGIVSRTGYTGEDGCELVVPASAAVEVWERLFAEGKELGLVAAGLGARDTLRLEAAMPLYGHELSESIDPLQAGLAFAVNLQGRDFVGREAIVAEKDDPSRPVRVGLELTGRRVPREHYAVHHGGEQVGEVTSGTFSPTLQKPIAMAYVRPTAAAVGTELAVDIRGSAEPAKVVPLPFYRRQES